MDIGAFIGEAVRAEVVSATPAPEPGNALARFRSDPAALKASALSVLDAKVLPPSSPEEAAALSDKISQAAVVVKNIEARRVQIVQPLKREATAVDAEARTWTGPVDKWIESAKRALLAYQKKALADAQRAEEARQTAIADAAVKIGQAEGSGDSAQIEAASTELMNLEATAPVVPVKGFKTDSGSNVIRKAWKVEVVNPDEVPDGYMVPDLAKLQAAVNAGAREIAGCNIWEDESLVTRTR